MVQEGAEAYAWKGDNGKWTVDNTKPLNRPRELVVLNNGRTILTLTSGEAQKIGFAIGCNSLDEAISQVGEKRLLKTTVYPEQLALYSAVDIKCAKAIIAVNAIEDPSANLISTKAGTITADDLLRTPSDLAGISAVKSFPILGCILPRVASQPLKAGDIRIQVAAQRGLIQDKFRAPQLYLKDDPITPADKKTRLEPLNGLLRTEADSKMAGNKAKAAVRAVYIEAATESSAIFTSWQATLKTELLRCQEVKEAATQPSAK
jgi:hypothetical protein